MVEKLQGGSLNPEPTSLKIHRYIFRITSDRVGITESVFLITSIHARLIGGKYV
jgi:hypothetical protein